MNHGLLTFYDLREVARLITNQETNFEELIARLSEASLPPVIATVVRRPSPEDQARCSPGASTTSKHIPFAVRDVESSRSPRHFVTAGSSGTAPGMDPQTFHELSRGLSDNEDAFVFDIAGPC